METSTATFPRFERSGFATIAVVLGAGLFVIGIAPRSERALFLKDDARLPAKAFSAVVPPLDATRSQLERSLLNNVGSRSSRSGQSQTTPAPPQFVASNQGLLPGTLPTLLSTGTAPGAAPPATDGTPPAGDSTLPSGTPSAPTGSQPPVTTPATGSPPATPGLPVPTAGAPADDVPVSAVPEPSTWAMMLLGFLAIGSVARRRKPSVSAISAARANAPVAG